jgi:hypothetical protein
VADFVGEIQNPEDPDSIAEWSRTVADLLNGQLSIGEPVSEDATLKPNGVKGHLLGSFVNVVIGTGDLDAAFTCTHNLNIPQKGTGTAPTELNVCWTIVRAEHSGNGAGVTSTISCNYETGDAVTANAIDLRFYANARTVADPAPDDRIFITLRSFPATR